MFCSRIFWGTMIPVACTYTVFGKSPDAAGDQCAYVNPFIGTEGDHGHFHPGAYRPFGMVKLGPDTYPSSLIGDGSLAHSGYNYADEYVRGFSHLRIETSGGGARYDRAWFLSVFPSIGDEEIEPEAKKTRFEKADEAASPGYYTVKLANGIRVELTVTQHAGFHKYTWPASATAHVIVDPGSRHMVRDSDMAILGDSAFAGFLQTKGRQYFYGEFSRPWESS